MAEIARIEKKQKSNQGRFLEKDEIKLITIAVKLGISLNAVYYRVDNGELEACRKGKRLLVTRVHFLISFLQGIINGKYRSRRRVRIKARELIKEYQKN